MFINKKSCVFPSSFRLIELFSNDVVGVLFVEEDFTVLQKEHVLDSCVDHGIPAILTAPPVPPEVEVSAGSAETFFAGFSIARRSLWFLGLQPSPVLQPSSTL